jgi:hypothetical protein
MKSIVKVILLISAIYFFSGNTENTDINSKIAMAFKSGDATKLVVFFNKTIEMSILDKDDVYSKQQAELIIRNFFEKYTPSSFQFVHQGGQMGNRFAIGEYISKGLKFRITIYLKDENNSSLIYNLRIQYDNN